MKVGCKGVYITWTCYHDVIMQTEYFEKDKAKTKMSRVMRKPTFCICENKEADQLCGNREADQCLCFRYIDCTIPLLS